MADRFSGWETASAPTSTPTTSSVVSSQYSGAIRISRSLMKAAGDVGRSSVMLHMMKPLMTKKMSTPALPTMKRLSAGLA